MQADPVGNLTQKRWLNNISNINNHNNNNNNNNNNNDNNNSRKEREDNLKSKGGCLDPCNSQNRGKWGGGFKSVCGSN